MATRPVVDQLERRVLLSAVALPSFVHPSEYAVYGANDDGTAGDPVTLDVMSGTISIDANLAGAGGGWANVTINLHADAHVYFNSAQTITGGLSLADYSQVTVSPGGGGASTNLLDVGTSLSIDANATLDLADNDMVLLGGGSAGETHVRDLITRAYAGGTWGGTGLTSSAARAVAAAAGSGSDPTALGYGQAKYFPQYSVAGKAFDGIAYNAADVYVKYTYMGDTNLDGKIDGSDYNAIDSNLPIASPNGVWALGDCNYDHAVTSADYNVVDANYGAGVGTPSLARPFQPAGIVLSVTEGSSVSAQIASFTDTLNTNLPASDYSAMVDWGDGRFMVAQVNADPSGAAGSFQVIGLSPALSDPTAMMTVIVQYANGSGYTARPAAVSEPIDVVPAAPAGLSATTASPSEIDLTWADRSAFESGYELDRSLDGGTTWVLAALLPADATSYHDVGLTDGTRYSYRVAAIDPAGEGPASPVASAITALAPPSGLRVTAATSGSISVAWIDNSHSETGYVVQHSPDGTIWSDVASLGANTTTYNDTALQSNANYSYRVRATSSTAGDSGYSNLASTFTLPIPAWDLSATFISQSEIDFTWQVYSGQAQNFALDQSTDGGTHWTTVGTGGDPSVGSYSLFETLSPATTYAFRLRIYTQSHGDNGSASDPATITTVPLSNPPSNLVATDVSDSRVDLTWTDNSDDENGFVIERSTDGVNFAPAGYAQPNDTSFSDTAAPEDHRLSHRVRAINAMGNSNPSNVAVAVTPPKAPSSLGATFVSATQVNLSWKNNSASTLPTSVEQSTDGGTTWTTLGSTAAGATTYAAPGPFGSSVTFSFRVRAIGNAGGNSDYSNTASILAPAYPIGPANLSAAAASDSEIDLTWADRSPDETGFKIERSANGSTWTQVGTVGANVTAFADTGLSEGTSYSYRVRATNAAGDSAYSNTTSTHTSLKAPSGLSANFVSPTEVDLRWTNSSTFPGALYSLDQSDDGGATWASLGPVNSGVSAFVASGPFARHTTFSFRVRAYLNSPGWESAYATTTLTTPDYPNAPSNLTATARSGFNIDLTWTDNSDNETGFLIQRSTDDGSTWTNLVTTASDVTNYTDGGLSENVLYAYRVAAVEGSARSTFTAPATARTAESVPTLASPATAGESTVTGTTDTLSVLGALDNGGTEADLTYTWSVASGPGSATFNPNGDNAAKNTTVTFTAAGDYTLQVLVQNDAASITSNVQVTVQQTLTSIEVTPSAPNVLPEKTQQFAAKAEDQFANDMDEQPSFDWSIDDSTLGTIDANGLFTATDKEGQTTIHAQSGDTAGTATVSVTGTVTINFDDLPVNTVLTDQYPQAKFSADSGDTVTIEPGGYGTTGNTVGVEPRNPPPQNYNKNLYLDFVDPVNQLKFTAVGNDNSGPIGSVHVFQGSTLAGTVSIIGGAFDTPQTVDLTSYSNVTRIEIVNVTDPYGLWYDDFSFKPTPPDLDIDSTNQYSFDPNFPRSFTDDSTDQIEDSTSLPGKRIQVDNGDSDGDGIPDFADGYNCPQASNASDAVDSQGTQFTPMVLEVPQGVDLSTLKLRFAYNASDPETDVSVGADGTYTIVGDGVMRLWTKDGDQQRDGHDLVDGGDFVNAGVEYTPDQLGITSSNRKVTLWAEALKPSQSLADLQVRASMLKSNGEDPSTYLGSDAVRLTAFGMQWDQIDPSTGQLSPADGAALSQPTPVISLDNFTVDNLSFTGDLSGIIGNLHFTGSIDDAASDLIAGDQGTIHTISVFAAGSNTPLGTINVTVTKSQGSDSLLKPYDFSGTFDATLTGITLQPGWNAFRLQASNAYGFVGTTDVSADVSVQAPPDDNIAVQLQFSADPYLDSTNDVTITATFTDNGGSPSTFILNRSGSNPMVFTDTLGSVIIDLGQDQQVLHPDQIDQAIATITNKPLGLIGEPVPVVETGANTGTLAGTTQIAEEDRPDYTNYTLALAGVSSPISSGPGDFNPYAIQFVGPAALLSGLQSVTADGGSSYFSVGLWEERNVYLMQTADGSRPAVLLFKQSAAADDSSGPPPSNLKLAVVGALDYQAGVTVGFTQGAISTVTGLVSFAKAIPGAVAGAYRYLQNLGVRYVDGDSFQQEKGIAAKTWAGVKVVGQIVYQISQKNTELIQAIYTGNYEPLTKLPPELRLAVEATTELLQNLGDYLDTLSDYEAGKLVGQILFQVLSLAVGPGELLALGKAGIVAKLGTLPILQDGGVLAAAAAKVEPLAAKLASGLATVGVISGSPEGRELEGLLSLYERIKSVDGLDPWPALQKALSLTADNSSTVDAALADLADATMPEIFKAAINSDGTVDLTKVPTVEQLYEALGAEKIPLEDGSYFWGGGRAKAAGLQNHHSAVQEWTRDLFTKAGKAAPTQEELDSMPAILVRKDLHIGKNGTSAFHAILRDVMKKNPPEKLSDVLQNLKDAYAKWDPNNGPMYWTIAAKWLRNHLKS